MRYLAFIVALLFSAVCARAQSYNNISTLPPAGTISGAEYFAIIQNGNPVRVSINQFRSATGVTGPLSSIIGDLADFTTTGGNALGDSGILGSTVVTGTGSTVSGNPACFGDTTGTLIMACSGGGGFVTGPTSATDDDLACFSGTTGAIIKDCGSLPSSFVEGPVSSRVGAAVLFANTTGNLLEQSVGYIPNVIDDCGAAGNGTTADDAAFSKCETDFKEFNVPQTAGGYRISSGGGTVIPPGVHMHGLGFQPGNPPSGAKIVCDLAVTPCITVGTGANGTASMDGIIQTRAAGSVPGGSVGILANEDYNPVLHDDFAMRDAVGFDFKMCTYYGVGGQGDRLYTGAISDAHFVYDGIAEFRLTNSRAGMDGTGDVTANTYERYEGPSCGTYVAGSGPNTIYHSNDQFDQGSNSVAHWIEFVSRVSGSPETVEYYYSNTHVDSVGTAAIYSDSSWTSINHFYADGLTIDTTIPFFALNATTTLNQFYLSNAVSLGSMTLSPTGAAISQLGMSNVYVGALTISPPAAPTASIADLVNVSLGGLTVGGNWNSLTVQGNLYAGSVSNGGTGNMWIELPGTTTPQVSDVNAGGEAIFGVQNDSTMSGTSANIFAETGTAGAFVELYNADGTTPGGNLACGTGDTGGCAIVSGAGPITLDPATFVNLPYLTASSAVCTDASKNLISGSCGSGGGGVGSGTAGEFAYYSVTGTTVIGNPIFSYSATAPQIVITKNNSGSATELEVQNNTTASGTLAELTVITGTAGADAVIANADGATPEAIFSNGTGDAAGLGITTLAGPIVLSPVSGEYVNIPYLTGVSFVCTDAGSDLLTGCLTPVGVVTGTSCTLAIDNTGCTGRTGGDCFSWMNFTSSSAVTVTIPDTLPAGCQVALEQKGSGTVALHAGGSTVLHTAHSFTGTTAGQYSTIGVMIDANSGGSSAVAVMTGDGA